MASLELKLRNELRGSRRSRRRQNIYKHVKASLETRRDFLEERLAVKKKPRRAKKRQGSQALRVSNS